MKNRTYLVFLIFLAVILEAACGSSDNVTNDAASVGTPSVDAASLSEASVALDVALDLPPALDTTPAMDTGTSYDVSSEVALANADASAASCNLQVFGTTPPSLLSLTGCFEPGKPIQPIAAFFPYEVNSPLWSDGAEKTRFLMVPAGSVVTVKDCDQTPELCLPIDQGGTAEDEGHFDLPVGSILIKTFSLQNKLIETRLLVRLSTLRWKGFSYEWNEDVTEATFLSDYKDRTVGTQVWHFPSQVECLLCHTEAAGRSLGPTTRQLDRVAGGGNQLDRMVAAGLLTARPKALAPYPDPRKPGPVENRARAYLQANCSFCHRPGGSFGDMDMRYATSLLDTNLCGVPSARGSGDPELPSLRVAPGKPADSFLSFSMHDRTIYAMPRLSSNLVDPDGTSVVDQWISGIASCPLAPPN